MTSKQLRPVAIVGGNRIPFARSDKKYALASNQDMLTATIDGLVSRFGLQGERLGLVAAGAVLKHSRDFNLTREVVLGSALSPYTPAFDIQQACGTGLQSIDPQAISRAFSKSARVCRPDGVLRTLPRGGGRAAARSTARATRATTSDGFARSAQVQRTTG